MRPFDIDYDEIDEFDEFGYGGIEAIRRMAKSRERLEERLEGRKRPGHARRDPWDNNDCGLYDGYDEDEFDRFAEMSFRHH